MLVASASLQAQTNDGKFIPEIAKEAAAEGAASFKRKDYERARKAYRKASTSRRIICSPSSILA